MVLPLFVECSLKAEMIASMHYVFVSFSIKLQLNIRVRTYQCHLPMSCLQEHLKYFVAISDKKERFSIEHIEK